jgi:hypothetical protein
MQRYLLVRGKLSSDGRPIPVSNPHHLDFRPQRFAGMKSRATPPEHVRAPLDLYEPCEEAILDDPLLRKAIRKGELDLIAKVPARDVVHARTLFEAMPRQPTPPQTTSAPSTKKQREATNG